MITQQKLKPRPTCSQLCGIHQPFDRDNFLQLGDLHEERLAIHKYISHAHLRCSPRIILKFVYAGISCLGRHGCAKILVFLFKISDELDFTVSSAETKTVGLRVHCQILLGFTTAPVCPIPEYTQTLLTRQDVRVDMVQLQLYKNYLVQLYAYCQYTIIII